MRTTIFDVQDDSVEARVEESPRLEPLAEYDGERLEGVRLRDVIEPRGGLVQLVEISAGGHFAMHSRPDVAFCQVVRGRGKLGLPDGRELVYEGPELYIFLPGTLHDWHAITEDTLLSVCLVRKD
jgi:quercetin dioxygenase-like cupin family protein